MTESDIIDIRAWSAAKRYYLTTTRGRLTPWKELTPSQRHMFYVIQKTRLKLEGPSS